MGTLNYFCWIAGNLATGWEGAVHKAVCADNAAICEADAFSNNAVGRQVAIISN